MNVLLHGSHRLRQDRARPAPRQARWAPTCGWRVPWTTTASPPTSGNGSGPSTRRAASSPEAARSSCSTRCRTSSTEAGTGPRHAQVLQGLVQRPPRVEPGSGIWVTNDASSMDPAVLRRFIMAVELPRLDEARRTSVWREAGARPRRAGCGRAGQALPGEPRRHLELAVRAASIVGDGRFDLGVVETILAENMTAARACARGRGPPVLGTSPTPLRVGGSRRPRGATLREVADGGRHHLPPRPPGNGEVGVGSPPRRAAGPEAPRQARLGHREQVGRRGGEEPGPAFQEAEREDAILLFDEADSFLLDRRAPGRAGR